MPSETAVLTDVSLEQLRNLDPTLEKIWKGMKNSFDGMSQQFFEKDGLVYRKWVPPQKNCNEIEIEQLVLPEECRPGVLQLAYTIPLAGHLGKDKTAQRILHRFYWPSIYKDVAEYCRQCEICQKSSCHHGQQAPLIPLPILFEPFKRIAMDIIGPLPRNRLSKRYVLVICDYATMQIPRGHTTAFN